MKAKDFPLWNGAGTCKLRDEAEEFLHTKLAGVTVGSIGWDPHNGNLGNNLDIGEDGTGLNCFGLPSPGMDYWEKHAPDFLSKARGLGKRTRISIVAKDPLTIARLAYRAAESGWDDIELDLSCPHATDRGQRLPLICEDTALLEATLDTVWTRLRPRRVEAKLGIYSNFSERVHKICYTLGHPGTSGIVVCNTFANGYDLERVDGSYRPVIEANGGYGGVSGKGIFRIAFAHSHLATEMRKKMKAEEKTVTGVGGLSDGETFLKYHALGIDGAQMATHILNRPRGKTVARVVDAIYIDADRIERS